MAEKEGFDLAAALGDVFKLNTGVAGRLNLEYIDIDLIDPDPANRKNLDGIDELAQNILLVGLQQPLAVRRNPDAEGRYIASSGHRRRMAIKSLVDDGEEHLRMTPCLVAPNGESPAMTRLKLISGNIVTQALSSAEMAQAALDVEQCICDLKEEGHEFPGKVRDYVAKVLDVSASKLAKLKVIRENLIPELKKAWEKGDLKESVAYVFARKPANVQRLMIFQVTRYGASNGNKNWWTERDAKEAVDAVAQEFKPRKGPKGVCEKCDAAESRLARIGSVRRYWDDHCRTGKCCHGCPQIGTCEHVCTHLSQEAAEAKAVAKAKKAKEKERQKKLDAPYLRPRIRLWKRFGEARTAAGLTFEEYAKKAHVTCFRREKKVDAFERGEQITMSSGGLPYCGGDGFDEWRIKPLIAAADALGVSLDYLLCRTDEPRPIAEIRKDVREWSGRGETPPVGKVIIVYSPTNDGPSYTPAVWDGSRFHVPGKPGKELTGLEQRILKWTLLPEDE